jgi:ABC-type phosphate/phosphonate transport system substrate-binding protein
MDAATIAILAIVVALVWALVKSRSTKPQPKLVVALKPAAAASVLAPRGSATLLEDSTDPKSGGGSAAAMLASSSGAFDIV